MPDLTGELQHRIIPPRKRDSLLAKGESIESEKLKLPAVVAIVKGRKEFPIVKKVEGSDNFLR